MSAEGLRRRMPGRETLGWVRFRRCRRASLTLLRTSSATESGGSTCVAWRDLDDPDAGGSEVHADQFMRRWAAAGLEIVHRTSAAAGPPGDGAAQRLRRRSAGAAGTRCSLAPSWPSSPAGWGRSDGLDRGVERRAVVLAGVVPAAAPDDPPSRPRSDVGPDPARSVRHRRAPARGPPGPAVLPSERDRHPVRGDPGGADRARLPARAGDRGRQRGRPVLHTRAAAGT